MVRRVRASAPGKLDVAACWWLERRAGYVAQTRQHVSVESDDTPKGEPPKQWFGDAVTPLELARKARQLAPADEEPDGRPGT